MSRHPQWEQRLADVLIQACSRPFRYGEWDCCQFACAAIRAVLGEDLGAAYRGQYATQEECDRVLAAEGGVLGIAQRMARRYHFRRVRPVCATRGSVVFGLIDGIAALGVCAGSRAVFVAPRGLARYPITDPRLRIAWEIA